jgi:hypothetical protein
MTAAEFREYQRTGKDPTIAPPTPPPRKPAHRKGTMNKTEAEYAARLEALKHAGDVLWYLFESWKFPLAPDTTLTPDFVVATPTGIEIHEIKGGHVWEDSWIKFKIAAQMYPGLRWFWCQKGSEGWTITERTS